jgi:glycosyltransferase involved in cell wall biosynthesis
MITVVHLITGLETGGAEQMLARLVTRIDRDKFRSIVICMTEPGTTGRIIADAGIPLYSLRLRRGLPDPRGLRRLMKLLHEFQPTVLQTWLYHADLLGLAASRLDRSFRLVWNVRCTESTGSAIVRRLLARWSALPDAIVVNSREGCRFHEGVGYRAQRWIYVPNGFDTLAYVPDYEAGRQQRAMLGIDEGAFVILMPARYHPMKDHATFLAAAAKFATRRNAVFLLAGTDVDPGNRTLVEAIAAHQLTGRVKLLGERQDLAAIYSAADVVTLSSAFGEGFPNVLGEAMASGVPCVATDVGDSAEIIGDTGSTVPPSDPEALAAAWERLAALEPHEWRSLATKAQHRIVENYDLRAVVAQYERFYQSLVVPDRQPAARREEALPS